jgi:hypothetical protein
MDEGAGPPVDEVGPDVAIVVPCGGTVVTWFAPEGALVPGPGTDVVTGRVLATAGPAPVVTGGADEPGSTVDPD